MYTLICLLAWAGFAVQEEGENYHLNLPCPGESQLVLSRIINTADQTIAEFHFLSVNDYRATIGIGVYPPGHEKAFYISPAKRRPKRKYTLLRVEGIPVRPSGAKLDISDQIVFRLIFEKVPLKKFHLMEGTAKMTDTAAWHFPNVSLER